MVAMKMRMMMVMMVTVVELYDDGSGYSHGDDNGREK